MNEKNAKKLLLAIGEIDGDIIEEALIKPKNAGGVLKKLTASAAAIALVSIIALSGYRLLSGTFVGGDMNGNASGGSGAMNGSSDFVGDGGVESPDFVQTTSKGKLTLTESGGSFVILRLQIYESHERIDVSFYGTKEGEMGLAIMTTKPAVPLIYNSLGAPKIYVDGISAESIPTEVGEYDIKLDFSNMIDAGYYMESGFSVDPFGEFTLYNPF